MATLTRAEYLEQAKARALAYLALPELLYVSGDACNRVYHVAGGYSYSERNWQLLQPTPRQLLEAANSLLSDLQKRPDEFNNKAIGVAYALAALGRELQTAEQVQHFIKGVN
jgi:hypothetical protein